MRAYPDNAAAAAEILAHKGRWQRKAARFSGAVLFVTHVNQWAAEFEIAERRIGRKR